VRRPALGALLTAVEHTETSARAFTQRRNGPTRNRIGF
jgi:hypothetical protein